VERDVIGLVRGKKQVPPRGLKPLVGMTTFLVRIVLTTDN